jgi:hypothetical protein
MLPALLLLGIGGHRRIWIPLPALLLWPFWLLGGVVWLAFWMLKIPWEKPLRLALVLTLHMSGTKVDIESTGGNRINVRMI